MFDEGLCTGYSILRCPGNITYLMSFVDGYLEGPVTIVNDVEKKVRALKFEQGAFTETIKTFPSGSDDFVEKLVRKIFPVNEEDSETMMQVSKAVTDKFVSLDDDSYIGTFCLSGFGAYFGLVTNGQPSDFGILITEDSKIKIGNFKEGALNGRARIIEKGGLILEGNYRNDLAVGEAYVYHSRQNLWKCIGKFSVG